MGGCHVAPDWSTLGGSRDLLPTAGDQARSGLHQRIHELLTACAHSRFMRNRLVRMCVFGGAADDDGICIEHGETACVVTLGRNDYSWIPAPDPAKSDW